MTATAPINGQEFTVTPRTRLEALATHRPALRYTASALLAAAALLVGTSYVALTPGSAAPTLSAVSVGLGGAALSVLGVVLAGVLHLRIRALQSAPEAWTTTPEHSPHSARNAAPWRTVIGSSHKAWVAVAGVAALWLVGTLLMSAPAPIAQSIGSVAILPGVLLLALASAGVFWLLFTTFIYMLWSILPMTAPASTEAP